MKRRSGAPDAETDLKIVLDFNNDGPSDINNKTLAEHRIQKLRRTLSPHLALAFLSKIGAKRAREADDRADRAIAARILQQDSPSTAAAIEAALRDASQGCTWREKQDMAAARQEDRGLRAVPSAAMQYGPSPTAARLRHPPPPRRACHTRGVRDAAPAPGALHRKLRGTTGASNFALCAAPHDASSCK